MAKHFRSLLESIQQWPSLGHKTTLRLVNFFLENSKKNAFFIKELQKIDSASYCSACGFLLTETSCHQCSLSSERLGFVIVPSWLDYWCFQDLFEELNLGVLCSEGYHAPPLDLLEKQKKFLERLQRLSITSSRFFLLFNASLEARLTVHLLEQHRKDCFWYYTPSLIGHHESLFMFHQHPLAADFEKSFRKIVNESCS